nr:hypothetical protein [Amylibacter sp.]
MLTFKIEATVEDTSKTKLQGLSDIALVYLDSGWTVVVASAADSALTTFEFTGGLVGDVIDTQAFTSASGTQTVWNMTFAALGDTVALVPATRYEDQAVVYEMTEAGDFAPTAGAGGMVGFGLTHSVEVDGTVFVFAGGSGVTSYTLSGGFVLTKGATFADTAARHLGDISAFANVTIGANDYLFTASAFDAGVSSFKIKSNGALSLVDEIEPGDFSGFSRVQALTTLTVEGSDFLVMASAGTSSLTTYKINAAGELSETDHLIDTLDTRFQNATLIESFEFDGRSFIVAAGSDDGISVLEISASGALSDMGSLADTYDIALDNISGLAVEVIAGAVVILVSSETDHGFTQITLDMSRLAAAIKGSAGDDTLKGTRDEDVINGMDGDDVIDGHSGDDLIIDGAGSDVLIGGGGADVFQFVEDGTVDELADLRPNNDMIDLSGFAGVNRMSDIDVMDWCDGVMIIVNSDVILVRDYTNVEFTVDTFDASNFIF